MANKNNNVYEIITNIFIKSLQEGHIPWHKGWTGGSAYNYISNKAYRGINPWLLPDNGGYVSYKQIQDKGWTLKEEHNSYIVTFWKMFNHPALDNNGNPILDDDGNPTTKTVPYLRYYRVFSIKDCLDKDGNPIPERAVVSPNAEPIAIGEQLITNYLDNEPDLKFINDRMSNEAYYSPALDMVQVPTKEQFKSINEYYSTVFHELTHSTGSKKRLDRNISNLFGNHEYSKEELVAEMGAAMLCNLSGIETPDTLKNSKAYIKGWIKALQDDPKLIISASSKAQKAVEMIAEGMIDEEGNLITEAITEETKAEQATVKTPALPETVVVTPNYTWSFGDGIVTIKLGNATGKFKIDSVCKLTVADLKKFHKEWVKPLNDPDLNKIFIEELKKPYASQASKKLIFTGEKPKKTEVTKVLNYLSKQKMMTMRKYDDKYIVSDGYMAIECTEDAVMDVVKSNPVFAQIAEKNLLDSVKVYKNGRDDYDFNPNGAEMALLMKQEWDAERTVDFSTCIKEENKYYRENGTLAASKMIDLFKNKLFHQVSPLKCLTQTTDSYRVIICPCRP